MSNDLLWWTCGGGYVELQMTLEQAQSCSHSGPCDGDVDMLSREPEIAAQLSKIDPDKLASTLREFGAWDDAELADHDQNLQRILWIACGDLVDEFNQMERENDQ